MIADLPPAHPVSITSAHVRRALAQSSPLIATGLARSPVPRVATTAQISTPAGWPPTRALYDPFRRAILMTDATARMVRTARLPTARRSVVELLIHQHLHVLHDAVVGHAGLDDGIVEAASIDLAPAVVWRLHRVRVPIGRPAPDRARPACVAMVRAASARLAGVRSWKHPAARRLRIALLVLSPPQREDAITVARTDRRRC